jgi:hypothetical protein
LTEPCKKEHSLAKSQKPSWWLLERKISGIVSLDRQAQESQYFDSSLFPRDLYDFVSRMSLRRDAPDLNADCSVIGTAGIRVN